MKITKESHSAPIEPAVRLQKIRQMAERQRKSEQVRSRAARELWRETDPMCMAVRRCNQGIFTDLDYLLKIGLGGVLVGAEYDRDGIIFARQALMEALGLKGNLDANRLLRERLEEWKDKRKRQNSSEKK